MIEKSEVKKMRIAKGRQRALEREKARAKAMLLSKGINEYFEDDAPGPLGDSDRIVDKGKKTYIAKSACKVSKSKLQ